MNCTDKPSPPVPDCDVTLVQQLSHDACTAGKSFDCYYDKDTM